VFYINMKSTFSRLYDTPQ